MVPVSVMNDIRELKAGFAELKKMVEALVLEKQAWLKTHDDLRAELEELRTKVGANVVEEKFDIPPLSKSLKALGVKVPAKEAAEVAT